MFRLLIAKIFLFAVFGNYETATTAAVFTGIPKEPTPITCRIVKGVRQCRHGQFPSDPVVR